MIESIDRTSNDTPRVRALEESGNLVDGYEGTLIIGAGLAGLVAAIRLKEADPYHAVMVVDKPVPQSNTLIAGQRYRHGVSGLRLDNPEELLNLLTSRNDGKATPVMAKFARLADQELEYWLSQPGFVTTNDSKHWFGPQFGDANKQGAGRGHSVIAWFKDRAIKLGVNFMKADAKKLLVDESDILGVTSLIDGSLVDLTADNYILANGNAGGYLFQSTNRAIRDSGSQLIFEAGLGLNDFEVNMLHPFSRTNTKGDSLVGCYETDRLEKARVYLDGLADKPIFDERTTDLLSAHEAHYHFPEIAERFIAFGGVVKIVFPDNSQRLARVSHHYSHMSIDTGDGVSVNGVNNLFAVGDAAGTGFWTNHKERFPGFALVKALVDGGVSTNAILSRSESADVSIKSLQTEPMQELTSAVLNRVLTREDEIAIRKINTKNLLALHVSKNQNARAELAEQWVDDLRSSGYYGGQIDMSLEMAKSYM